MRVCKHRKIYHPEEDILICAYCPNLWQKDRNGSFILREDERRKNKRKGRRRST